MYMTNRAISALCAIAVAGVGLAACGGGGSGEIVARVAGVGSISKASLEHWMPVEAVVLYQEHPTRPVPKGVIPDPPNYTACIAYLQSTPQKLVEGGPKPTAAQLKSKCVQKNQELKELTLNTLIGWYWTIGAGRALGMKASDVEVRQRLEEVNARSFPKKAEFTNYLKLTGQTVQDMLLRSRVQLYEVKIAQQLAAAEKLLPKGLTVQQKKSALAKSIENLPPGKLWPARTTCRKGYVVSACKEYRGSQPPGIPN
jgi:foldase protein PrsA